MATLGTTNQLTVIALTANGAYLDGGDLGEVLLPNRYVPENCQIDDKLEVFLYTDSLDRFVATTDKPYAQLNEFANLKVVAVNKLGAFLDWGLPKDLLVPLKLQQKPMEVGRRYLVKVLHDDRTERLVASSKIDKLLDIWPAEYKPGEQVQLIIGGKTDLGYKAIINNQHWGLLFDNELKQRIFIGQAVEGYVKRIREDGRVDLTLNPSGKRKVNNFTDQLLAYLNENKGFCPLHDKSSPEEIARTFGVSKKAFKATVGHLLKKGQIEIKPNGIALVSK